MFFFRADGNLKIGSGHVMRCSSIAEALVERGEEVAFVLADDSFEEMLREKGFRVYVLHSDYTDMDAESETLLRLIHEEHIDTCIVDSYYVTDAYFEKLQNEVRTVYLDDLMDHAWPVDVLINYNVYAEESQYEKLYHAAGLQKPEFILGSLYAPLRREFSAPLLSRNHGDKEEISVLVSTGGSDNEHLALRLLNEIVAVQEQFSHIHFHFIVGMFNEDWKQIQQLAQNRNNMILHRNVTNMRELMCQCDLAVSAAGSTLYELCRCGVPVITYAVADNQLQGAEGFANDGAMVYSGDSRLDPELPKKILDTLKHMLADRGICKRMSDTCQSLVDGKGADRIAFVLSSGN